GASVALFAQRGGGGRGGGRTPGGVGSGRTPGGVQGRPRGGPAFPPPMGGGTGGFGRPRRPTPPGPLIDPPRDPRGGIPRPGEKPAGGDDDKRPCRVKRPDPLLRELAAQGGGGYFELHATDDLAATFTRVADELHHQYLLAFRAT